MKKMFESARSVDVVLETDVLVVGSGPGGLAAALGRYRDLLNGVGIGGIGCRGCVRNSYGSSAQYGGDRVG